MEIVLLPIVGEWCVNCPEPKFFCDGDHYEGLH